MFKITMKFINGHECSFKCESYKITRTVAGELTEFSYEGAIGECPVYFRKKDVELIIASNLEKESE